MPKIVQHDNAPRILYDRKAAARQLSISVRSLDYLISQKKIVARRLGKKVMVTHAELVRFAGSNHYDPMTPARKKLSKNRVGKKVMVTHAEQVRFDPMTPA